jgi:hypothetical protein
MVREKIQLRLQRNVQAHVCDALHHSFDVMEFPAASTIRDKMAIAQERLAHTRYVVEAIMPDGDRIEVIVRPTMCDCGADATAATPILCQCGHWVCEHCAGHHVCS